jgi:hypothetical protein
MVLAACHPTPGTASRLLLTVFLPFVLGLFFFYYLPHKFRVEGDRLRRAFGAEYDAYARVVPDFVPSPWPRIQAEGSWSAASFRENRELGWVVGIPAALLLLGSRLFFELPFRWPW